MNRPTGDRATGAVLYAAAAILLALGALWWIRAAPPVDRLDPELAGWRAAVEDALPEHDDQIDGGSVVLDGETREAFGVGVRPGPHLLSIICAGRGEVRVRVTTADGVTGGRSLSCTESPRLFTVPIGLDDTFELDVSSSADDRAVLRWQLRREPR